MRAHLLTVPALALAAVLLASSSTSPPRVDLSAKAVATVRRAVELFNTTGQNDDQSELRALFAPRVTGLYSSNPAGDFVWGFVVETGTLVAHDYVLLDAQATCDETSLTCTVTGTTQVQWHTLPWELVPRTWVVVFPRSTAPLGLIAVWR